MAFSLGFVEPIVGADREALRPLARFFAGGGAEVVSNRGIGMGAISKAGVKGPVDKLFLFGMVDRGEQMRRLALNEAREIGQIEPTVAKYLVINAYMRIKDSVVGL